jgi:hypothetical protein
LWAASDSPSNSTAEEATTFLDLLLSRSTRPLTENARPFVALGQFAPVSTAIVSGLLGLFLRDSLRKRCLAEENWKQLMEAASHPEFLHTLLALVLVSVASVVGSLSFAFGKRLQLLLQYLLSAIAGALLGTALYSFYPKHWNALLRAEELA